MNRCDLCLRKYSECMNSHENLPEIEYGRDGQYEDAVIECSWYMPNEVRYVNKKEEITKAIEGIKEIKFESMLDELKQIVIEDVPHKYQGRLLECLNENRRDKNGND